MSVKRFGVSLEEQMLSKLDKLVQKENFPNRSRAIGFLIQDHDVEEKWEGDEIVAGAIVLVFDHHKRDLQKQLTAIQHDYHSVILASQHLHLNHNDCLETISVKGKASQLVKLANQLKAVKGIKHGDIVMSTTT